MTPLKIKPIGFGSVTRTRHASPGNVVVATTPVVKRSYKIDGEQPATREAHHRKHPPKGRFVTPKEIAAVFGFHRMTAYRWVWEHPTPLDWYQVNTSMVVVDIDTLIEWVERVRPSNLTDDQIKLGIIRLRKAKALHEQPPKG